MTTTPTAPHITTRSELETLIGDVVGLQLRLDARRTEMESEIAAIRERHTPDLDALERELIDKRVRVHLWADENRDFFRGKKSVECHHGTVGFRSGPPRLEKIKPATSWDFIAQKLRRLAWADGYIRSPKPQPEVNKEAILADRHKLPAEKLEKVGLRIVQDEKFYISPRARAAESLLQAAA